MKAWQIEQHGGPEVMKLVEVPLPEPKPGFVRIRVEAGGLNYSDIMIRRGLYVEEMAMPRCWGGSSRGRLTLSARGWTTGTPASGWWAPCFPAARSRPS